MTGNELKVKIYELFTENENDFEFFVVIRKKQENALITVASGEIENLTTNLCIAAQMSPRIGEILEVSAEAFNHFKVKA